MPAYLIKSNARPSLFAYPPDIQETKEKEVKAVPTAQLSITRKTQQRQEKKKVNAEKKDSMQIDTPTTERKDVDDKMDEEKKDDEEKKEEEKEEEKPEPEFELLSNPARVTRSQLKHITFDVDSRYIPVTESVHGIVLLKDTKPGEAEDIIKGGVPTLGSQEEEGDEPEPPEAFEFVG